LNAVPVGETNLSTLPIASALTSPRWKYDTIGKESLIDGALCLLYCKYQLAIALA
jgi:hypothetical protein